MQNSSINLLFRSPAKIVSHCGNLRRSLQILYPPQRLLMRMKLKVQITGHLQDFEEDKIKQKQNVIF